MHTWPRKELMTGDGRLSLPSALCRDTDGTSFTGQSAIFIDVDFIVNRDQKPPGHDDWWLEWRRRHQARSRWFHKRARLARNYALVS
jgi:hypothetical protein